MILIYNYETLLMSFRETVKYQSLYFVFRISLMMVIITRNRKDVVELLSLRGDS